MGLGLCLECLTEYKLGEQDGQKIMPAPAYAVTLAPRLARVPGGPMAVAVPCCYAHLGVDPERSGPPPGAKQARGSLVKG
jgi:hypothetical protein